MRSFIRGLNHIGRAAASLTIAALMAASVPGAAFAQNGVIRPQQPAPQPPRPTETIRQEQTTPPAGATPQQQNPQTGDQQGNQITQQIQLSPEVTRRRVGVREDQVKLLSLQDAIALALQNNLDIEAFREGVQISQYGLFALRGFYDITSSADVGYRSATTPTSSVLSGGRTGSLTSKSLFYNFSTFQNVESTGGSYLITFDNSRLTTSNTFAQLSPQYNANLTFQFTQPLLRNFTTDINRRQIQLAKKSLDLSDSQFRQRVIEIINQVQRAYWDLVFAIENEEIARESVRLTQTQLENNQKMVEAGTLAPIELRSTEAALESRKVDVISALQSITTAENLLKGLIMKDPNDQMWYSQIDPTDQPQFGQSTFNLEESTRLAFTNRPELDQMRLQVEQKQIDIDFFKNQTKPQVDLVALYTNTGLAGAPVQSLDLDGNPQTAEVLPRFQGGFVRSIRNLIGQDFRTYQVGVSISFPWRNRTAEGNLGRTLAEARQLDARQRQLVQTVQIDVRNALQSVEAARQRFEAARAARLAAEAQLAGEVEKFRAGLSTNFLVLQYQTDLAVARGNEVRALTDYNKSLADLQRVTGMTLVSNNVQVTSSIGNGGK